MCYPGFPSATGALALLLASGFAPLQAQATQDTLDPVEVRERKPHGFESSPWCFDPDQVRRWYIAGDDLIVKMGRREGRRLLRLTLSGSCDDTLRSMDLGFTPGLGLRRVCGNVGDRVVSRDPTIGPDFVKKMPRSRIATADCRIDAVEPADDVIPSDDAGAARE